MPEDIKKEAIDNETAENKAEEIEIEGADEESTQAAEEAKDTDMNETESSCNRQFRERSCSSTG